jgi:hypothetical protein
VQILSSSAVSKIPNSTEKEITDKTNPIYRVCSVGEKWVKSYCSTFRCYLVKFI